MADKKKQRKDVNIMAPAATARGAAIKTGGKSKVMADKQKEEKQSGGE